MSSTWREATPSLWRALCWFGRELGRAIAYMDATSSDKQLAYIRALAAIDSLSRGEVTSPTGEMYLARLDETSTDIVTKALGEYGFDETALTQWRQGQTATRRT